MVIKKITEAELTFKVPPLRPCIFPPPPYRVEEEGHAHSAADLQPKGVVDIGVGRGSRLLGHTTEPPHLRQHLGKSLRQVVARHRDISDGPDGLVEQGFGILHVNMSSKEALTQLQKSAAGCNHHLIDVVGRVGQDRTDSCLEGHGGLEK